MRPAMPTGPLLSGYIPILPEKGAFSFKLPRSMETELGVGLHVAGVHVRGLLRVLRDLLDSSNISMGTRWLKTADNLAGALSRIRNPSACQLRLALFLWLDALWAPNVGLFPSATDTLPPRFNSLFLDHR